MQKLLMGTFPIVERLKIFLKLFGLWSLDNLPKCLSKLYNFGGVTTIVFLFLYDFAIGVYVFTIEDVYDATNNLCMNLTLLVTFGKVLNLKILMRQINDTLRINERFKLDNYQEVFFIDQRMSFFIKLAAFDFVAVNLCILFGFIKVIFSDERELPFLGWYPVDWQSNTLSYLLLYVYQVTGMIIQANLSTSADMLAAYMMYMASIQLELLGDRLEKLNRIGMECQPIEEEIDTDALIECISTYQDIMMYVKQLQKSFTYAVFVQISLLGVVICSIAYQLTYASLLENFANYSYLVTFVLCMIAHLSFPCHFANEIKIKHDRLTTSIFNCGWHFRSTRYGKIVIIFMEMANHKVEFLVGNWIVLDLNLFVSIMKFVYRLYTVLV